jgi:hypothetical protein
MSRIDRIERRFKLNDMRILLSVVEAGSMGKAAERLGTSQQARYRTDELRTRVDQAQRGGVRRAAAGGT